MFRASFESGVSHSRLLSLLSLLSHEVQETAMDNATSEQASLAAQMFAEEQYGLLNPILDGQRSGFSYRVFPENRAQGGRAAMVLQSVAKFVHLFS